MNEIVFQLLEDRGGLRRVPLKVGAEFGNSFFFATPDWEESKKLMILIHGSGVVRAGQWARRLIMNEDLDKGTQVNIHRLLATVLVAPKEMSLD